MVDPLNKPKVNQNQLVFGVVFVTRPKQEREKKTDSNVMNERRIEQTK